MRLAECTPDLEQGRILGAKPDPSFQEPGSAWRLSH